MEFGLEKYTKTIFKIGKSVHSQNLKFDINNEIQELEQGTTYMYVPKNWWTWRYTTATNERKSEKEIHQEIKNDTEIRV